MELNLQTKWDLEKYYYSNITDSRIEEDFSNYEKHMKFIIEKYKGKLRKFTTFNEWNSWFEDSDEHESISKAHGIFMYFSYVMSLDTQNQKVIKINCTTH